MIGTSTEEIARLFLVSKSTMAARITRAKKKIVLAGIPLSRPPEDELQTRLDDICRTIYLSFTAGYTPSSGPDLLRADLAGDAVDLAWILHQLVPESHQAKALGALLSLQHSRRDSRVKDNKLVTLGQQDRTLWHQSEIAAAVQILESVPQSSGYSEELRLQALIAAEHCNATTSATTDWNGIAALYTALESLTGSAVVRLNRAVAVAETEGPLAGLTLLGGLDGLMPDSHRLHAVRAELALRANDRRQAQESFKTALALVTNEVEKAHLAQRLAEISAASPGY